MQKILFSTLVLSSLTFHSHAEIVEKLPEMVVTATRSDIQQNQLATASTVYTRHDIEQLQVKTLPELLRGSLGLDMAQNGGYGQLTSVFMRGTNSDHVLVLIDGIKVGSVTDGSAMFQLLPMDQIERVEIVRGPQSSLYGSEAIGGVIQIFTRTGKNGSEKPKFSLDAGGGSYDTYRSAGTVSGRWKNSWYSLGASSLGSEGFSTRTLPDDPDRDGYQNTAVNARVGHRFNNGAEVEAFFMRAQGSIEFDGSQNKNEFVQQVVGTSASLNITDNWKTSLRFGQSVDENAFSPHLPFYSDRFNSTRWNSTWLNQLHLSDTQQLIIGSDGRVDEVDSDNAYAQSSRYDVGAFAELHSRWFDNHYTNASVRWDKNEAFGDYVTGNLGWRYAWQNGISVLASFGNAFKAPTFNELYWPNTGYGGGNPNLKAEQSRSYEAGVTGDHDWGQWELRAYHTDVTDLINGWPPVNIDKAQINGIEAQISTELWGWRSKLSLNLLSPRDRVTNQRLIRRADKTLSFDLSRSFAAVDVGLAVLAQGNRLDTAYDASYTPYSKQLNGYVTVDLRTAYHINKQWSVDAKLSNLFDADYQTVNNYNTAGRNFFFTVHYNN